MTTGGSTPDVNRSQSSFRQGLSTHRIDLEWASWIHKGDEIGFLCNCPGRGDGGEWVSHTCSWNLLLWISKGWSSIFRFKSRNAYVLGDSVFLAIISTLESCNGFPGHKVRNFFNKRPGPVGLSWVSQDINNQRSKGKERSLFRVYYSLLVQSFAFCLLRSLVTKSKCVLHWPLTQLLPTAAISPLFFTGLIDSCFMAL